MSTELFCSGHYTGPEFFEYVVEDVNHIVVASGVSSCEQWAEHDAGGYHTKKKFNELFPDGWHVKFAWRKP